MNIDKFPKYIFWSYKEKADLPLSVITQNVLLYGDVKDIILLTKLVEIKEIKKTVEKITNKNKYKKRINFIEKVII
ncbi:MAG: hypothetical protein IPH62_17885 [Ignavibacteriae bacterium]|nr:hypothetical protein [Ignavibacteriota bacterium]